MHRIFRYFETAYDSRNPKNTKFLAMLCAILLAPVITNAATTVYMDEAAFLLALEATPYTMVVTEGFEDDSVWGSARSSIVLGTNAAPSIESRSLTWTSNNLTSGITTSMGAARTGDWGVYSSPHGSYGSPDPGTDCSIPGDCGDGFKIQVAIGTLFAAGGWVDTNTPFAKVGIFEGAYTYFGGSCDDESIDCESVTVGTSPKFIGLVNPNGFTSVEFRELEGKTEPLGGDLKLIFGDDFTIALRPVPLPASAWLMIVALATLCGRYRARRH